MTSKREPPLVGPGLIPIQMGINDRKEDYGPETGEGCSSLGAYPGFLVREDLTCGS
jgi:hypothetical protein